MECPNCENENDDSFDYCPFCGTQKPTIAMNFCPQCIKDISSEFSYCPTCGTELISKSEYLEEMQGIEFLMIREEYNVALEKCSELLHKKNYNEDQINELMHTIIVKKNTKY